MQDFFQYLEVSPSLLVSGCLWHTKFKEEGRISLFKLQPLQEKLLEVFVILETHLCF